MRDEAPKQALDACDALSEQDRGALLAWLCGARPEAVLAAVAAIKRHQALVRGLLEQRPPR